MVEANQRIRRSDRAVFRELTEDEGGVLLHLDSGAYHGLNPMGTAIWGLIGDGTELRELVEEVRTRLSNPPAELEEDVTAFIEDLVKRDLLALD